MRKRRQLTPEMDENDLETYEPQRLARETCMNPWNGRCINTDIALYIVYKGNRLPVCHRCWEAISSQDIEWKYD